MKTKNISINGSWVEIEKISNQIDYREAYSKRGVKEWAGYYKKNTLDDGVGLHGKFERFFVYEDKDVSRLAYIEYYIDKSINGEAINFNY